MDGPSGGRNRFVPKKVLCDPYARRLHFPPGFSREAARGEQANDGRAVLGVLPTADWASEPLPSPGPRHTHDTVIYEVHVKGFTARANSGVAEELRGTFRGLIEKIDHLTDLGVTVVELLPVHQYDPQEGNYWGYMTMNFFAPHSGYADADAVAEFREMVDALHAAGIEVWLDVVYNHTAEGDHSGPTYNLAGIDNDSYYIVGQDGAYYNDTGCGNTTQAADIATRALVLRSLRALGRADGRRRLPLRPRLDPRPRRRRRRRGRHAPDDQRDRHPGRHPRPARHRGGLGPGRLPVGPRLPGHHVAAVEREVPRRRPRLRQGRRRAGGGLMSRVYGSADLFPDGPNDMYRPYQSINFVTAHDGFCLYDLVSYNERHNEANGHGGTDGSSDNRSWNCGWEGDEGAPPEVLALRMRQMKNFAALMMLSNGVPMIVAGDEFANTQGGNNNPYNQDNEITWLDWDRLDSHRDLYAFFRAMIALRKARRSIARSRFWREDVRWFGTAGAPDTSPSSHSVAWHLSGARYGEGDLYVMVNAFWEPLEFAIQVPGQWRRIVDTTLAAPEHVRAVADAPTVGGTVTVTDRSIVVLST